MADLQYYVVFDKNTGDTIGFYNYLPVVKSTAESDKNFTYKPILKSVVDDCVSINVAVDIEKISEVTCIESMYLLKVVEAEVCDTETLISIKNDIVADLQNISLLYIVKGLEIEVDGKPVQFKFGADQQFRMKELIDNYSEGDIIWYSASDEFEHEFEYSVIKSAYKQLFNNKTYIHTYCEVFSKWIKENLTLEMYESKEEIYTFGYINDEIAEEVERRYERLKLR